MSRLKLLLTNDDGICAEGLRVLAQKVSEKADVFIMAPSGNRSGVSNSITMMKTLEIRSAGENMYSCSGTPVDCVVAALRSDFFGDVKFDAVLSGINQGANMGTDLIYSGTAAAARQASLYDIPAIALSVDSDDDNYNFNGLASFAAENLDYIISLWRKGAFVNLNAFSSERCGRIVPASLCNRDYHDKVIVEKSGDGWITRFSGGALETSGDIDNDFAVSRGGDIAFSLVASNPELLYRTGGMYGKDNSF